MVVQAFGAEAKAIAKAFVQVWGIAESSPKLVGDVKRVTAIRNSIKRRKGI